VTEALYLALHDSLWAFVRRRVSSDADADDVVQDVFLRMHTRMHTLDDQSSARAWAFAIARNALIDHHRRQARAPETLAHEPAAPEVDELEVAADAEADNVDPRAETPLGTSGRSASGRPLSCGVGTPTADRSPMLAFRRQTRPSGAVAGLRRRLARSGRPIGPHPGHGSGGCCHSVT